MKTLLKSIITAIFAANILIFTAFANEWRAKPVQCGDIKQIYKELIDDHSVKPMFVAIEMVTTSDMDQIAAAVVMYMNLDEGKWILLEQGDYPGEMCVIALGTGLDFDIDEDLIREILTGELKS